MLSIRRFGMSKPEGRGFLYLAGIVIFIYPSAAAPGWSAFVGIDHGGGQKHLPEIKSVRCRISPTYTATHLLVSPQRAAAQ
jgi:hypothetical protein